MNPDSHLGATEKVRDPAPVPSGSQEAGCASQPEEVAAGPATPPDGPRSLFPDADELYQAAMMQSGYDPASAQVLIRSEWVVAREQMVIALVYCGRQAHTERSQESS